MADSPEPVAAGAGAPLIAPRRAILPEPRYLKAAAPLESPGVMRAAAPSQMEGLKKFQSPGKGRGLRALRRFVIGEQLFSCPAFTCVLTVNERGNHCECCFARYQAEGDGLPAALREKRRGRASASAAPMSPTTMRWSLASGWLPRDVSRWEFERPSWNLRLLCFNIYIYISPPP